jgi:ankyrin repeat protein
VRGENEKIVRLLLKASADVNAKASVRGVDYTALDIAKINGYAGIIKLLKEYGAK